jgi:hypothetical protein
MIGHPTPKTCIDPYRIEMATGVPGNASGSRTLMDGPDT